jgi:hypothetical protein
MSEHDPLDTAALDKERKAAKDGEKAKSQTDAEDIKWLMSSKQGRRILWGMLERAGVYRLSFNTNSMTMAFAEGARNEGLRLLNQIHTHCADLYPTMLREATK